MRMGYVWTEFNVLEVSVLWEDWLLASSGRALY